MSEIIWDEKEGWTVRFKTIFWSRWYINVSWCKRMKIVLWKLPINGVNLGFFVPHLCVCVCVCVTWQRSLAHVLTANSRVLLLLTKKRQRHAFALYGALVGPNLELLSTRQSRRRLYPCWSQLLLINDKKEQVLYVSSWWQQMGRCLLIWPKW